MGNDFNKVDLVNGYYQLQYRRQRRAGLMFWRKYSCEVSFTFDAQHRIEAAAIRERNGPVVSVFDDLCKGFVKAPGLASISNP